SQITLWRLASRTFGVICLSMMVTLGILLKTSKLPLLPTPSPGYCIAYSPRKVTTSELCGIKNHYMCKQRPI
ncbi:Natural killer cells antigen CD94, partial [Heterocephalus glaber]